MAREENRKCLSLGAKLAFWILAVPIAVLSFLNFTSFYFFKIFDVSALVSPILVILLVWERLRESLSKKLDYLHRHYLTIYDACQQDIFSFRRRRTEVERKMADLKRYGKFMRISLHPRCLLNKLDSLLISCEEFDTKIKKIDKIAEESFEEQIDELLDMWHHFLGIKQFIHIELYKKLPDFEVIKERARITEEEEAELIEGTKNLLKEWEEKKKEIFIEVEDFLKRNNLRLTLTPHPL